jgi:hypothetical protein
MKKLALIILLSFVATSLLWAATAEEKKTMRERIEELEQRVTRLEKIGFEQRIIQLEMWVDKLREATNLTEEIKLSMPKNASVLGTDANELKTSIFGIRLGQTIETLKKDLNIAPSSFYFEDKDHPSKIWDIQSVNEFIKTMRIMSFHNQVYRIELEFQDGSNANFQALKEQLIQKYPAEDTEGLTDVLFGQYDFETKIDGVKVQVFLNRDKGILGEDDKISLRYIHLPLRRKVQEEIKRRKAAKIGDKL